MSIQPKKAKTQPQNQVDKIVQLTQQENVKLNYKPHPKTDSICKIVSFNHKNSCD